MGYGQRTREVLCSGILGQSFLLRARRELEGMVSTQGRVYSGSTLLCREVYRARRELEGMVLLPTESAALIEYILRLRAHAKVGGWVLNGYSRCRDGTHGYSSWAPHATQRC